MKPATRRNLVLVLVLGLVAAGLVWAFRPEPVTVDLQPVARGAIALTIAEEGRTRVKEVFVVSAPIAGRLRRIELKPGDPVRANDTVLALVEPAAPPFLDARSRAQAEAEARAAEAGRDLAAAELEKARAELAFAESEMERVGSLASHETASRRALDQAAMQLRAARAAVDTAQAALRLRQHEMEVARASLMDPEIGVADRCVSVRSPVDGTVLRLLQESEAVLAAGTPLVEIGDPAAMELVAEVLTTEAVRLKPGTAVVVERWGGPDLRGRVRRIEPHGFVKVSALGVEERRVLVVADLDAPPEAHAALGHGFRVDLRFVLARAEDVAKVPVGALFRQGDGWAAFAAEDGTARLRPVRIGLMDDHEAEVLDGLQVGEQVVVHPSDRVEDGVEIVPRRVRG